MSAMKCIALACVIGMTAGCGNPAATATTTTAPTLFPTVEAWSSVLVPGGASSRSFDTNASGTISITLTSAGATVGLGVGLPRTTGGGCRLGVVVTAVPGPTAQIVTQADQGSYCVQVYDLGTLTNPVPFAMTINHP
jgi:hypothetical protein